MKRIFTLLLAIFISLSFAIAQDKTGFGTSGDYGRI